MSSQANNSWIAAHAFQIFSNALLQTFDFVTHQILTSSAPSSRTVSITKQGGNKLYSPVR